MEKICSFKITDIYDKWSIISAFDEDSAIELFLEENHYKDESKIKLIEQLSQDKKILNVYRGKKMPLKYINKDIKYPPKCILDSEDLE